MDVTARRLHWTRADGSPELVSGELVIVDPGVPAEYALHLVDGYPVDPETLIAVPHDGPEPATPWHRPSFFPTQDPPSAGR